VAVKVIVGGFEGDARDRFDLVRLSRRRQVVHDRASPRESLHPEQLLGVEAAVGRAVLGVALARQAAVRDVVHG